MPRSGSVPTSVLLAIFWKQPEYGFAASKAGVGVSVEASVYARELLPHKLSVSGCASEELGVGRQQHLRVGSDDLSRRLDT